MYSVTLFNLSDPVNAPSIEVVIRCCVPVIYEFKWSITRTRSNFQGITGLSDSSPRQTDLTLHRSCWGSCHEDVISLDCMLYARWMGKTWIFGTEADCCLIVRYFVSAYCPSVRQFRDAAAVFHRTLRHRTCISAEGDPQIWVPILQLVTG